MNGTAQGSNDRKILLMTTVDTFNLPNGTIVKVQGRVFRTIRAKQVNYLVEDEQGKTFNLRRNSRIEVLPPEAWTGADAPQARVRVETFARPTLKLAQAVKISGRGAGRYDGVTGFIAKRNASTYGVLIPNVGIVNASHGLVTAQ